MSAAYAKRHVECDRIAPRVAISCGVSDDRNNLGAKAIEACQLQKNWVQRGVVKSSLKDLARYVDSVDKRRVSPVACSGGSFNSQPLRWWIDRANQMEATASRWTVQQ
jgi:hypothetical protein